MAGLPRTVLISGCSSGIGLELAVQLARDSRQRYQGKGPRAGAGMASRALSPLGTISTSPSLPAAFVGSGRTQDLWRPPSHLSLGVNPSSNEHFLSTYWMPGTVLGAGNRP